MNSSDNQNNDIAARIKEARAALGLTQKELCEIAGMKLPSLRDYELGNRVPGGDAIGLLTAAGINAHWLITGKGNKLISDVTLLKADPRDVANIKMQIVGSRSIFPLKHSVDEESNKDTGDAGNQACEPALKPYVSGDFVEIDNYVNVRGSAGPGTEVFEEAIVKVRVDARLLRERIGSNFTRIKIASVSGDSMEPTLSHGDQVLVDTSCNRFIDDAIYAIQQDGHLRFKRIQLKLDGSIVVRSDGSSNSEIYSADEAQHFFVVGMVIPFKFGRFKV